MKSLILAAGYGSRLKPFTNNKPKPLISVVDKPVLEHLINNLVSVGIKDIYINLHYMGDLIKTYFEKKENESINFTWRTQSNLNGPAGALLAFRDLFEENEDILVLSGDAIHNFDISNLIQQHKKMNSLLTFLMKEVTDPTGYGVGYLDKNSKILKFIEKPVGWKEGNYLVSCGIYCINTSLLKDIPHDKIMDFADIANKLIREKKPVYGYVTDKYWIDMGTPENLLRANIDFMRIKLDKLMPNVEPKKQVWYAKGVIYHSSANIIGPTYIGENVIIEENVDIIGPTMIGANSTIGASSHLNSSVIMEKSTVERATILYGGLYSSNKESIQ
ncbi:sugar phosphate nucleotidyltransferase [Lysinibacillus sp. RSDA_15]|uniref:sugar phosphate nucleotidyltransferase n=1 Tax=Lysinibacillus TaxID=400634 RepID=UPI0018CDFB38|nr:NDP-sugar synthase [Lysinibacillus sphaericus]MBG9754190.1 hypothetical protein [Lysinibacillus sphaericus]QTB11597.1 NDP-sugar synthase [Lysinibacillus sphaericus]